MNWTLKRNSEGRLELTMPTEVLPTLVTAVRPFPISAPDDGVALIDRDGHEVVWIDALVSLDSPIAQLITEDLHRREFMPVIEALHEVSSFITPSTWKVSTDRGETSFVLGGEEFIRRLSRGSLLIADTHGIHYLVRDIKALDRNSRKLLDRFL